MCGSFWKQVLILFFGVISTKQDSAVMTTPSINKPFTARGNNQIQCGVCGRCYRLPRILPCLHTFCSECILSLQRYPIINEITLSHDTESINDWSSLYENNFDSFRIKSEIVLPPVEFQSPDFQRRTLPRSRRKRGSKPRQDIPTSRSFCDNMHVDGVNVFYSSGSLDKERRTISVHADGSRDSITETVTPPLLLVSTISDRAQPRSLPPLGVEDQEWLVMCPQCWSEVRVSTTLDQLPRNLVAERCARVDAWQQSEIRLICELCSIEDVHADSLNLATTRCLDCEANLCSLCQDSHKLQTKTKFHKLINVQQEPNSEISSKMDNKVPNIYREDMIPSVKRLFPVVPEATNITQSPKLPSLFKFQRHLWDGPDSNRAEVPGLDHVSDEISECSDTKRAEFPGRETASQQCLPGYHSGPIVDTITGSDPAAKCLSHPGKALDMFCVTCEQNACMDCVMLTHLGHDCQFVTKQLFRNQMKDVDRLIRTALPQVKDVDDQLKSLTQVKATATELSNKVMDEVNTFIDSFVHAVETHRKQLLAQVMSFVEKQERSLSLAEWRLQQTRADVHETCSFLAELLTAASDVEILSLKTLLTRRLLSLTEASPGPPPQQGRTIRFCPTAKGDIINEFQMFGRVITTQASPEESFLHGEGLNTARVKRRTAMIVSVLDRDGVPYTESDVTVEARIVHQGREINLPMTYKHLDGGDHLVEFVPVNQGTHLLHVLLNGNSIKGSPFTFSVKPTGRAHAGTWKSLLACAPDERQADESTTGGQSLALPEHCVDYFWSCCGTKTYSSDCPVQIARSSSVRQATV